MEWYYTTTHNDTTQIILGIIITIISSYNFSYYCNDLDYISLIFFPVSYHSFISVEDNVEYDIEKQYYRTSISIINKISSKKKKMGRICPSRGDMDYYQTPFSIQIDSLFWKENAIQRKPYKFAFSTVHLSDFLRKL